MDGNKEMEKDAQNLMLDNSDDMVVTDIEVEKDVLSHHDEIANQKMESPHSKAINIENEETSYLERTGGEKEELCPLEYNHDPAKIVTLLAGDQTHHELPAVDCLRRDPCLVKPNVGGIARNASISYVDANTDNIHGISENMDGTNVDPHIQLNSITSNESLSGIQRKDETGEELNNGMIGIEMSKGVVVVESPAGSVTKEELNNGKTRKSSTLHDETKKKEILSNGMSGIDLIFGNDTKEEMSDGVIGVDLLPNSEVKEELRNMQIDVGQEVYMKTYKHSFLLESNATIGDETGTEEEQVAFMKELEAFHKDKCLEFKPPRFYGEPLNCLKLWRAVIKLGGYEQVTSCKLWRQVGESFKPPKTCTTVSWTFRCFYEKALLEYEKHKMRTGELPFTDALLTEPTSSRVQTGLNQASGSGRARRDAAARAMQGWHSQRHFGNGEVGDPIIKDKSSTSISKREKQLKSIGILKRKKPSPVDCAVKVGRMKGSKPQLDTMVVDIGSPADWVKINVQRTKDCFEVYALVPGLLREEVRVQSDPVGRLVISGQPEHADNPWGVTPFKKVVSLPSRIDPHQTSAVVTLHGQLFVRVPFELSDL